MNLTSGDVHLAVRPSKEAKTAVVAVGFKADACPCLLRALGCGASGDVPGAEHDQTALLYAMFMKCNEYVHKTAADETKARVAHMGCATQGGEFVVVAECEASRTTIRKTLGAILKGLNPSATGVRGLYAKAIRVVGLAPNGDAFDLAADSPIFLPIDDFVRWEVPAGDTDSPLAKAIRLYQDLAIPR